MPDIYPIDFTTCTAQDVIERSIVAHPSALADALKAAAKTHSDYYRLATDWEAAKSAHNLSRRCLLAADNVDHDRVDLIMRDFGQWISALNCAAKLQGVPQSCLEGIVSRRTEEYPDKKRPPLRTTAGKIISGASDPFWDKKS